MTSTPSNDWAISAVRSVDPSLTTINSTSSRFAASQMPALAARQRSIVAPIAASSLKAGITIVRVFIATFTSQHCSLESGSPFSATNILGCPPSESRPEDPDTPQTAADRLPNHDSFRRNCEQRGLNVGPEPGHSITIAALLTSRPNSGPPRARFPIARASLSAIAAWRRRPFPSPSPQAPCFERPARNAAGQLRRRFAPGTGARLARLRAIRRRAPERNALPLGLVTCQQLKNERQQPRRGRLAKSLRQTTAGRHYLEDSRERRQSNRFAARGRGTQAQVERTPGPRHCRRHNPPSQGR